MFSFTIINMILRKLGPEKKRKEEKEKHKQTNKHTHTHKPTPTHIHTRSFRWIGSKYLLCACLLDVFLLKPSLFKLSNCENITTVSSSPTKAQMKNGSRVRGQTEPNKSVVRNFLRNKSLEKVYTFRHTRTQCHQLDHSIMVIIAQQILKRFK